MADLPSAPANFGFATIAKTSHAKLRAERQKRKLDRLKKEAKAAERKAMSMKKAVESEAQKRARHASTMRSYFTFSRNSFNREALQCSTTGANTSGDLGGVGASAAATDIDPTTSQSADTQILLSCPDIVPVSDNEEASKHLESDPDISDDEIFDSDDDAFIDPPSRIRKKHVGADLKAKDVKRKKPTALAKMKKNYDLHRKFQSEWTAKEPWSKAVLVYDGVMHMVQCTPCTIVRGKPIQMAPKWHTISKHSNRDIHKKCMVLFSARAPTSVIEQIQGCTTMESRRKRVQFAILFQLLASGRPMIEFEDRFELYEFLNVPEMPRKHWCDGSGWLMAEHVYDFVKQKIQSLVSTASFFALSADETSASDNTSWIVIHAYVMINWCRVPLMLTIQKMESDGATANNLITTIMAALSTRGGVTDAQILEKLLCFGADGVNSFQGVKNGVTTQIKEKYAPFSIGVHCCAHRLNLAAQSLSSLSVMHSIEEVQRTTHSYFTHSPKKAVEFRALSQQLSSKGLKLLKNIKTRWMSCIGPIRRLLAEYKGVIAMMHANKNDKKWGQRARANLSMLLDPYVLLGMMALLPMLEAIDALIQWAQRQDAFICDFVGALGTCRSSLYTFYINPDTAFRRDEFHSYNQVLQCSYEQILMKWDANLNLPCETLTFVVGGESLYALHDGGMVHREGYAAINSAVQNDCKEAAEKLLEELTSRFPDHNLMDALGVVYPQYWMLGDCSGSFRKHLDIIKSFYGEPKWVGETGNKRFVPTVLDKFQLESEQSLFKIAMIANAHAAMQLPPLTALEHMLLNPLTKLWRTLDANTSLAKSFGEYIKLAQIAMVHVLDSVEDERAFSALTFLKDRLRNRLDHHLGLVVGMCTQSVYSLKTFP